MVGKDQASSVQALKERVVLLQQVVELVEMGFDSDSVHLTLKGAQQVIPTELLVEELVLEEGKAQHQFVFEDFLLPSQPFAEECTECCIRASLQLNLFHFDLVSSHKPSDVQKQNEFKLLDKNGTASFILHNAQMRERILERTEKQPQVAALFSRETSRQEINVNIPETHSNKIASFYKKEQSQKLC